MKYAAPHVNGHAGDGLKYAAPHVNGHAGHALSYVVSRYGLVARVASH